jgi:hypothetical protein
MVLAAAGSSSQSRTRVRTAEDRTREAWQPRRRVRISPAKFDWTRQQHERAAALGQAREQIVRWESLDGYIVWGRWELNGNSDL